MKDITNPDYYKNYKIEVTDAITAWNLSYIQGNIIKYIVRAGKKGNRLDDLDKALWYLQKERELYGGKKQENITRYNKSDRESTQKENRTLTTTRT